MPTYKKTTLLALIISLCTASALLYYLHPSFSKHKTHKNYHLSIVMAHNEKIQELLTPYLQKKFKEKYHAHLDVTYIKRGSQDTNVKIIEAIFKKNKGKRCGSDVIWGGSEIIFDKLEKNNRFTPLHLPNNIKKNIPKTIAGTPLYGKGWVGAFVSSFGIIYNKLLFKKLGLPTPTNWQDLTKPHFFDKIISVDPCQSNNIWLTYCTMRQFYGWEKGWQTWTKIAANSVVFLDKSSSAAGSIAQGAGLVAATNDLYAQGTIHRHGTKNLGFILPRKQTILTTDAVAGLVGGNAELTQFFIEAILSPEFQLLLILKQGVPQGPQQYTIGRMSTNKQVYQTVPKEDIASATNPFTINQQDILSFDVQQAIQEYPIVSALFKAYLITPHKKLKKAWKLVIDHGSKPEDMTYLTRPPLTEKQVQNLTHNTKDPLTRQKMIIAWTNDAIARYQHIIHKYQG